MAADISPEANGSRRAAHEPSAQAIGATSTSADENGSAFSSLPSASSPMPATPSDSPAHSRAVAFSPKKRPIAAAHSGIVPQITAAMPDDTRRSAKATVPLPSTNMRKATGTADAHCRAVGQAAPRTLSTSSITAPTTRKR